MKRSLEQWKVIIKEMKNSGIPQEEWCKDRDINLYSLRSAQSRLNRLDETGTDTLLSFVGVEVSTQPDEVILTCGKVTITTTASAAAAILAALP